VEMLLMQDDVNANLRGLGGMTALMFFALLEQEEIVRMLLEAGVVDPDRVNASQCIAS